MNNRNSPPAPWSRWDWLFALFVMTATLLAYQPVWHAGFFTDDAIYCGKDTLVQKPDGWWRMWVTRPLDYVPATTTSFWVEWHLCGDNPFVYHLDNVILHALGAILIWRVLLRLKIPGAKLAAAIFALHPVAVETVAWISERKNTLAIVFYAAALLFYLVFEDTGHKRWYWLAAAAFVVGIFAKTAIAPLPVVLLGMVWWRRGRISLTDARRILLFFVLAGAAGALGVWIQHSVNRVYEFRSESFPARLAGAGWDVWFYLGKCLWPQTLIFIYPSWHINPKNPLVFLPTALVLAALGLFWVYRRGWSKPLLLGFGYLVVLLLPVLGFVDISFMYATPVEDHWQYFAMIGPITLVAAGLTVLFAKCDPRLRIGLCALLLACLGFLTWKQSRIYVDPFTLWQATVTENPGSFLVQSAYGRVLFQKGRVEEAIACYQKAVAIEPTYFDAHYDLGNIYLREGQPIKAFFEFQNALSLKPDNAKALNNMAWILATCPDAKVRNGPAAVELARRADEQAEGKDPSIIGTLAAAYAEAGQFPAAIAAAQRALSLAVSANKTNLIKGLQAQIDSFQSGIPTRDASLAPATPGSHP